MKLALALVLVFATIADAQCGGGCCPGGGCGGGFCPMGGCCPGGQCQPRYSQPRQQGPQPDYIETPPVGSPDTPQFKPLPVPPQVQTPPLPPQPTFDWAAYDAQQKEIAEAQKKLTDQGEKSLVVLNDIKLAVTNQKGCQCQPTNLQPVLDAIADLKNTQPAPPVTTPQPQSDETHIVVVADHNAPYWQKLAEQLTKTRQTYKGVQDTTLPEFPIGIHPQAVVYRNSVPVRIVKGEYQVSDLLARLSRGDSI